jgi:hypothetical protein
MKRKTSGLVPRVRKVGAKNDPVVSRVPLSGYTTPPTKLTKRVETLAGVEQRKERKAMAKEKRAEAGERMVAVTHAVWDTRELKRRAMRAGRLYKQISAARLRIEESETAHSQLYRVLDDCCAVLARIQGERETAAGEAERSKITARADRGKTKIIRTLRAMAKTRVRLVNLRTGEETIAVFDDAALKLMGDAGITGMFPADFLAS